VGSARKLRQEDDTILGGNENPSRQTAKNFPCLEKINKHFFFRHCIDGPIGLPSAIAAVLLMMTAHPSTAIAIVVLRIYCMVQK
jgi:hypothetical protein